MSSTGEATARGLTGYRDWTFAGSAEEIESFGRFIHPDNVAGFGTPAWGTNPPKPLVTEVLETLAAKGVRYAYEPSVWGAVDGNRAQYVRKPTDVLVSGEATCIDMSVVVASCLLRAGVHPWVVFATATHPNGAVKARHAFVIAELIDGRWEPAVRGKPAGFHGEGQPPWTTTDANTLLDLVADSPDRFWVIDAARLCTGYDNVGDAIRGDLRSESGTGFLDPYSHFEVCDLADWDVRQTLLPSLDGPLAALEHFLDPGDREIAPAENTSIAQLVSAKARLVPFQSTPQFNRLVRDVAAALVHREELVRVVGGLNQVSWMVLWGDGGAGKTRTAIELLVKLQQMNAVNPGSGTVGLVRIDATLNDLAVLLSRPGFVGLLLDYGDVVPEGFVKNLIEATKHRPAGWGQVVVVVTARAVDEWTQLFEIPLGEPLRPHERIEPFDNGHHTGDVRALFDSTVARFSSDALPERHRDQFPNYLVSASALHVVMAAALTALNGRPPVSIEHLYDAVLGHEHSYWAISVGETLKGPMTRTFDSVTATVSLCAPYVEQAEIVVGSAGAHGKQAVRLLETLFIDAECRRFAPVQPDPLADHLIRRYFDPDNPDNRWLQAAELSERLDVYRSMLETVERAWSGVDAPPSLIGVLADLSTGRVDEAGVLEVALDVSSRNRSGLIAKMIAVMLHDDDGGLAFAERILEVPVSHSSAEARIDARERVLGTFEPGTPEHAAALEAAALEAASTSHLDHALLWGAESIDAYRDLGADDRKYMSDLAKSLHNQSIRLSDIPDRADDALTAINEAIDIHRKLTATDPNHRGDLAKSLENQSIRLGHLPVGRTGFMRLVRRWVDRIESPIRLGVGHPGWCGSGGCCTSAPIS